MLKRYEIEAAFSNSTLDFITASETIGLLDNMARALMAIYNHESYYGIGIGYYSAEYYLKDYSGGEQ